MIEIAKLTRTHNIPTLGICLGFQMMVLEYAQNVLGDKSSNADTSRVCPFFRALIADSASSTNNDLLNIP